MICFLDPMLKDSAPRPKQYGNKRSVTVPYFVCHLWKYTLAPDGFSLIHLSRADSFVHSISLCVSEWLWGSEFMISSSIEEQLFILSFMVGLSFDWSARKAIENWLYLPLCWLWGYWKSFLLWKRGYKKLHIRQGNVSDLQKDAGKCQTSINFLTTLYRKLSYTEIRFGTKHLGLAFGRVDKGENAGVSHQNHREYLGTGGSAGKQWFRGWSVSLLCK